MLILSDFFISPSTHCIFEEKPVLKIGLSLFRLFVIAQTYCRRLSAPYERKSLKSDRLKILHIVHQYAPDFIGGTELYTATLAAKQVNLGHQVSVFVPSPQINGAEKIVEDGITVYRVLCGPRSANQVFATPIFGSNQISAAFSRCLAETQPDIVHIQHLMGVPAGLTAQLVKDKIPYVVTLHDYWYGCANGQLLTNTDQTICDGPNTLFTNCGRCAFARAGRPTLGRVLAPTLSPLIAYRQNKLRNVLSHAQAVIPPTHFVQSAYEKMGFDTSNFEHIPHGIEVPAALVAAAQASAAELRATIPAKLNLVYIGGISPQKGLHTLIEAFNHLPADAQLTIYGDLSKFPDYVSHLQRLIRHPAITLAGHLARTEVWNAIASADFVVIPTHWFEASPLIIDEVFAVGTPILASDIGSVSEKVRHNEDGWLVPPGDAQAWKDVIDMIYAQPELRGKLRANIRPIFSQEEHLERIMALYEKFG